MRQGRSFAVHVELASYDNPTAIWQLFSENGSRLTFSSLFDSNRFRFMEHPVTLKYSMSADYGPNCKFDPALDASDSKLCSARRINVVGQSYDFATKHF